MASAGRSTAASFQNNAPCTLGGPQLLLPYRLTCLPGADPPFLCSPGSAPRCMVGTPCPAWLQASAMGSTHHFQALSRVPGAPSSTLGTGSLCPHSACLIRTGRWQVMTHTHGLPNTASLGHK